MSIFSDVVVLYLPIHFNGLPYCNTHYRAQKFALRIAKTVNWVYTFLILGNDLGTIFVTDVNQNLLNIASICDCGS